MENLTIPIYYYGLIINYDSVSTGQLDDKGAWAQLDYMKHDYNH